MKKKVWQHRVTVTIFMMYLALPLIATFLYSIATSWTKTVLPDGYTFKWYAELYGDPRFVEAMTRTFLLTVGSMIVIILVMVPTVFVITVYLPKLERLLKIIVLMPYAIPGVVAAVGLIRAYAGGTIPMIIVVSGAFFVAVLPFMYQGVRNSLQSVDSVRLMEAAELLGASRTKAFTRVILPNIKSGIIVSSILAFSILFGEFVLTNLLVGGSFETIQIYLFRRMNESGHLSSSVVISYFIVLVILCWCIIRISSKKKQNKRRKSDELLNH
ncbi:MULTISPECIES: ABC transporter permease [Bacillus]|uniref:ABC transporter permease n=2 Tax=Bacillus TaxID=1386 RepID=A0A0M4FNP5_9BACI|nr:MULTISPECIES: ABC transporter permease subunit [Bacillus]ALC80535.1 ABC transporter permease [Bacillus gobiensis]MBP1083612.1 putative spermidine/putrescine transport system permease protein [Bacillus capparidis]MED1094805.1 ABC transporter permease subunit [Bacillus capparidis]